jgi:hypothetical protein
MAHVTTRGSRPGERRGGRQKGTPNRRTLALRMGLEAAGASPEVAAAPPQQQPLTFLLAAMNNNELPIATRIDAAKAAAPYLHFRKGLVDTSGRDVPITVQVLRFSDVADELEASDRAGEPEPVTIEHDPPPAC